MDSSEPIAVIGMAGRFPAAPDVDELWRLLRAGRSALWSPSDADLLALGVRPETLRHPSYVRARMRFEGAERFDAGFFGFSARHAEMLDPQQRLFLEGAWEALESAGCDPQGYDGAIGVFASCGTNVYMLDRALLAYRDVGSWRRSDWADLLIDADKDHIATRISYKLGLTGPSVGVQSTCSSSLVAVHLACQSLLRGECDIALAGGISLISCQRQRGYVYVKDGMDSPDGHCRAFDANAAGTAWGSGFGIVVLKRSEDAQRDRDHLHALIEGTAINNDGAAKMGYMAPSVRGQQEVVALAQAAAGVSPDDIDLVEAHGTGTSLGDSIELAALIELFGSGEAGRPWPCALGSIKTNIGHLDIAAGVTGLIKTILCLEHQSLVPSLNCSTPNPLLLEPDCPLAVNTQCRPWPSQPGRPRRAGVSSLGFGGTNAHAIVREAPRVQRHAATSAEMHVVPLSARSPAALASARSRLAAHLRSHPQLHLADVAFTLQTGRRRFSHRQVIVADGREQLLTALDDPTAPLAHDLVSDRTDGLLVFGCSDETSAPPAGVLQAIAAADAAFQRDLDECISVCRACIGMDVSVGRSSFGELAAVDAATARALRLVLEYSLARWWQRRGVKPSLVLGQGTGAASAACIAAQLTLEQALRACVSGTHRVDDISMHVVDPQQAGRAKRTWREVVRDSGCVLLQLAPGRAWDRLLNDAPSGDTRPVLIHSFAAHEPDHARHLPNAAAALWLHGTRIDWQRWHLDEPRRVPLPTYPFEGSSYWLPLPEMPREAREPTDAAATQGSGQRFFVPSWRVAPLDELADVIAPEASECWLILADDELAPQLARRLEAEGGVPVLVRAGEQYQRTGAREFSIAADAPADYSRLLQDLRALGLQPRRLVHCWSLLNPEAAAVTAGSFWEQQQLGYFSLLYLAKALAMLAQPGQRSLVIATRGTYCVANADVTCNLSNAPMTGLCKVMAQELSELRCVVLDLHGHEGHDGRTTERCGVDAQRVLGEILHGAADPSVAYRGELRLVQTLDERALAVDRPSLRELRERGVYVITGGLGKIGLALARRLAQICKARLVLLTRNAFPDRSVWGTVRSNADGATLAAKANALLEIEALGAQVAVYCADVRNEAQLQSALAQAKARFGPLSGVFHLAADMSHPSMHCPLTQLGRQDVEAQLGPKVEGFYALRSVLRQHEPDFVMLFSSNSSILGGFGFAAYAAANAFLDHCAGARLDDPFPWLCSNWDRWSDRPPGSGDGELYTIGMDEGLDALLTLMSHATAPQVVVATTTLHQRRERWVLQGQRPVAKDLPQRASSTAMQRVLPRTELERTIAQVWQDVLGCHEVGVEDSFLDLGGDSLIGLRILSRLRELFQVEIPLKALLGPRPTVASLVLQLVAELQRAEVAGASLSGEPGSLHRPARPSAGNVRAQPR